jgi:hypothetical protein
MPSSRYPGGVPLEGESDDHYRRRIWLRSHPLTSRHRRGLRILAPTALRCAITAIRAVMHDYYPTILITCLDGAASGTEAER